MNRSFRIIGPPVANGQRLPRDSGRSSGRNGRFSPSDAELRVPTFGQNADFGKDENLVRRVEPLRTPEKSERKSGRRRQRRESPNAAPSDDAAIPLAPPLASLHPRKISGRSGRRRDGWTRFILRRLAVFRIYFSRFIPPFFFLFTSFPIPPSPLFTNAAYLTRLLLFRRRDKSPFSLLTRPLVFNDDAPSGRTALGRVDFNLDFERFFGENRVGQSSSDAQPPQRTPSLPIIENGKTGKKRPQRH